jgi:hypothetical protein
MYKIASVHKAISISDEASIDITKDIHGTYDFSTTGYKKDAREIYEIITTFLPSSTYRELKQIINIEG